MDGNHSPWNSSGNLQSTRGGGGEGQRQTS